MTYCRVGAFNKERYKMQKLHILRSNETEGLTLIFERLLCLCLYYFMHTIYPYYIYV